jgi:hypothetical protein
MDYLYARYRKEFTFLTFDRKGGYDPKVGGFRKILRHGEDPELSPLDILGWQHGTGKILWLEVKTKTTRMGKRGKLLTKCTKCSDGQEKFRIHCSRTNAYNEVVYSIEDAEAAVRLFKEINT